MNMDQHLDAHTINDLLVIEGLIDSTDDLTA
jgi:hypothetical protein